MKSLGIVFLLIMLLFASCTTLKPVATSSPPKEKTDTTKQITVVKDSIVSPKQKTYHISLLLPFNFEQQFKTDSAGNDLDIVPSSLSALNFYEGFLSALDSNEKKFSIQYDVYDTERDSMELWRLLNSKQISESDVVMAMLSNSWNTIASKIASARQYNLFLLQGNNSSCLNGNEHAFLTSPSNNTQCKLMAEYLYHSFSNPNAIIIYRDFNKREAELADFFFTALDSISGHHLVEKLNYSEGGFNALKTKLTLKGKNLLIIPSSDESYISSILTKLSDLKDYAIAIGGLPTWEHFESMDPEQLESFNTNIFNSSFIDYSNEVVNEFRKNFIALLHADPLFTAYQAHDLLRWIEYNFSINNNQLELFEKPSSAKNTTSGIDPVKVCNNCGFENFSLSILKYKNGGLEKINH